MYTAFISEYRYSLAKLYIILKGIYMNKKTCKAFILIGLFSVICLTSCSYIEVENKVKDEIDKISPTDTHIELPQGNNDEYEKHQKAEDDKLRDEIEKSKKEKKPAFATENQLHNIGDTFISCYGSDEWQYEITVNSVKEYDSFGDIKISISDTRLDSLESQEIYDLNSDSFKNAQKLIVCDITIKNISVELPNDENNAAWFNIKDFSYTMANEAIWFSNHPDELTIHDYYHYTLPIGDTITYKIGWLYDSNEYSLEDLFLIVGAGTSDDFKEYVYLS